MELNSTELSLQKTIAPQFFFEVLQRKNRVLAQYKDFYAIYVGFRHSKFYIFIYDIPNQVDSCLLGTELPNTLTSARTET